MSVALLITDESQIASLVSWGLIFSRAKMTDLLVIAYQRGEQPAQLTEIDGGGAEQTFSQRIAHATTDIVESHCDAIKPPADNPDAQPFVPGQTTKRLKTSQPAEDVLRAVAKNDITLLILPAEMHGGGAREHAEWMEELYLRAPCDTLFLRAASMPAEDRGLRILVPTVGDPDEYIALHFADEITRVQGGEISTYFVQQFGDEYSQAAGERELERIVFNAVGRDSKHVKRSVQTAENLAESVRNLDLTKFDLVLLGTRWQRKLRSLLFSDMAYDEAAEHGTAIAGMRKGFPLHNRILASIERFIHSRVPQLDREQRIDLAKRLNGKSHLNFDFVALICLSTMIAALGIVRNSPAVVIGAMLVAPLMTPLIGMGLGLIQANYVLVRAALRSVVHGFALGFAIGFVIALLIPGFPVTGEMEVRGSPAMLDWIVALASGIAAAYATGRPHLLSALPGVAIAAALVPPMATSGMATAAGRWSLAGGSMLLFLANIVAIVLGTTISFWAVGVRTPKLGKSSPLWARVVWWMLVAASIGLALLLQNVAAS